MNAEKLLELLAERDASNAEYMVRVEAAMDDSLLATLRQVLNVESDGLKLLAVYTAVGMMAMSLRITYDTSAKLTPVMQMLHEASTAKSTGPIQQSTLSIGIPLELIDSPAEVLEQWLLDVTYGKEADLAPLSKPQQSEDTEETVNHAEGFDTDQLSDTQILQILLFQPTTKTTLQ